MRLLVILSTLLLIFAMLVLYSACVVAGEADEREQEYWNEVRDEQMD